MTSPTPLPQGYRLAVLDDTGEVVPAAPRPQRYFADFSFTLVVLDDAGQVGHADFFHEYTSGHLMCSDVFVDPAHRRRGLASALYLEAERLSGKVLHPYSAQYPDGRTMWRSPRRRWGRGVAAPTDAVIEEGS